MGLGKIDAEWGLKCLLASPYINSNIDLSQNTHDSKVLCRKIDILGREVSNTGLQLHIYDDGSVEKRYLIKWKK